MEEPIARAPALPADGGAPPPRAPLSRVVGGCVGFIGLCVTPAVLHLLFG